MADNGSSFDDGASAETPISGEGADASSSVPPTAASKEEWRAWAKVIRASLDMGRLSEAIVASLTTWPLLANASMVLTYMPLVDEVNLTELIERLGHVTFATTRTPDRGGALTVHELGGPLEVHRYGFLQPHQSAPQVAAGDVSLLLLPGLAFDLWGVRLGRGAGYYDELLSRVAPQAVRVGVAPAACVVDRLPRLPHDELVHFLATEEGVTEVAT